MRLNRLFSFWISLLVILIFSIHLTPPERYTMVVQATTTNLASSHQNGDYIPSPMVIDIDGDFEFRMVALARGWEGDGSITTPYVIEGYSFMNSTSTLVNIRNTAVHFIFQHNWLDGISQTYTGIYLQNVTQGVIYANNISNCYWGIYLAVAFQNTIESNLILQNDESGILMYKSGNNSIFNNTIVENANLGILMDTNETQNNSIYWNDFVSNGWDAAMDSGVYNDFAFNYYYPGTFTDLDDDGIGDLPYIIPGGADNQDNRPRVYPNNDQTNAYLDLYLTRIRLIKPVGGEILTESVVLIHWRPAKHSYERNETYTLWYTTNQGISWHVLVENITGVIYSWNVSTISTGYWNALRIGATTSDGTTTFYDMPLVFGIRNEDIPYTLSPPQILPWKARQTLFESPFFYLEWREAIDSCKFPVVYAIYSSTDNGETWTLLKDQLYETSYLFSLNDCLPPKEQWPLIRSYHLKVKASSNRGGKTSEDIIEIPVIPYTASSSAFPFSAANGRSNTPINIIPLVQLFGGASILGFMAILVVVIRRQQEKS